MNEIVGKAEGFELRIGQRRIEDHGAGRFCANWENGTHRLDFTPASRLGPCSLQGSHAFAHEKFVEDALYDLLRSAFCSYTHEVGRDFEGIELTLQQARAHVVVLAICEPLLQYRTRNIEQDKAHVDGRYLREKDFAVALAERGTAQNAAFAAFVP